jgi:hypothetical protein
MNAPVNAQILRLCAWSGLAAIVVMAVGFGAVAGFIPPPSPDDPAQETADFFNDNQSSIRFGMILSMVASALLMPFAVALTVQIRRIEGRHSPLAWINLGLGSIFVLEFIYLLFFWQTATFRDDRTPELIQAFNDMAWIPFVGLSSTLILQCIVVGVAILLDRRSEPIFPRWAGYFNLWVALMFTPGTFNVFFKDGPLAWDGIIAFYMPIAVFVVWMCVMPWLLNRAVDQQVTEEEGGVSMGHGIPAASSGHVVAEMDNGDADPTTAELAAEVARLREEVARVT